MNKYKVYSKGEIKLNFEKNIVCIELSKLFSIPVEKTNIFFLGKGIIIRRNIDKNIAIALQNKLNHLGIITYIESDEIKTEKMKEQEKEPNTTDSNFIKSVDGECRCKYCGSIIDNKNHTPPKKNSSAIDRKIKPSAAWKNKFDLFDKSGVECNSYISYIKSSAFKSLKFKERKILTFNPLGFLFGPAYYFSKKMWMRGLWLLTASFIMSIILTVAELSLKISIPQKLLWLSISVLCSQIVNYDYYRYIRFGENLWQFMPKWCESKSLTSIVLALAFLSYSTITYIHLHTKNSTSSQIVNSTNTNIQNTPKSDNKLINLVKSGVLRSNKTISIGQAFDNWSSCENKNWESFTTNNGIRVVQFTCQHTIAAFIQKAKSLLSKNDSNSTIALDIISDIQTFQFTINQDDTFQINNVIEIKAWRDGITYEENQDPTEELAAVYADQMLYDQETLNLFNAQQISAALVMLRTRGALGAN